MLVPRLKVIGTCWECKQVVEVSADVSAITEHLHQGARCRGSGYSPKTTEFVIQTQAEAVKVALFLKNDRHEFCLSSQRIGHSMNCSDGRGCSQVRQKLAQALANYYLSQIHEETDSEAA